VTLGLDKVSTLGMVVAELVTNCYEHGFTDGSKGEIVVALSGVDTNGKAKLTISDNGVGFLVGAASNRNGLTLVRRLAQQVNGSADVQCEGGTRWTITFPAQAPVA
jgi:two-component sensor histidine kinase